MKKRQRKKHMKRFLDKYTRLPKSFKDALVKYTFSKHKVFIMYPRLSGRATMINALQDWNSAMKGISSG